MVRFKHQDDFLIGSLLENEPPNTMGCRGLTQSFCSLGAGTRNAQAVRASHLLHTQDTAKPYSYLEHQSALLKQTHQNLTSNSRNCLHIVKCKKTFAAFDKS